MCSENHGNPLIWTGRTKIAKFCGRFICLNLLAACKALVIALLLANQRRSIEPFRLGFLVRVCSNSHERFLPSGKGKRQLCSRYSPEALRDDRFAASSLARDGRRWQAAVISWRTASTASARSVHQAGKLVPLQTTGVLGTPRVR